MSNSLRYQVSATTGVPLDTRARACAISICVEKSRHLGVHAHVSRNALYVVPRMPWLVHYCVLIQQVHGFRNERLGERATHVLSEIPSWLSHVYSPEAAGI